jgi:hypothetical protein
MFTCSRAAYPTYATHAKQRNPALYTMLLKSCESLQYALFLPYIRIIPKRWGWWHPAVAEGRTIWPAPLDQETSIGLPHQNLGKVSFMLHVSDFIVDQFRMMYWAVLLWEERRISILHRPRQIQWLSDHAMDCRS